MTTKEDDEDFESTNKNWICYNAYVKGEVDIRYHCYITGKYEGSEHRDCNVNVKS